MKDCNCIYFLLLFFFAAKGINFFAARGMGNDIIIKFKGEGWKNLFSCNGYGSQKSKNQFVSELRVYIQYRFIIFTDHTIFKINMNF